MVAPRLPHLGWRESKGLRGAAIRWAWNDCSPRNKGYPPTHRPGDVRVSTTPLPTDAAIPCQVRWSDLSERERVRLGAGFEEGDLQRPLADGAVLAYELVHAAVAQQAGPVLGDVHAV
jgi:hypothetical protein